jgi:hypothetical protein
VRGAGATRKCSDCHLAAENDNNAWLAQLLLLGTNQTNFIGRYCWVAKGEEDSRRSSSRSATSRRR